MSSEGVRKLAEALASHDVVGMMIGFKALSRAEADEAAELALPMLEVARDAEDRQLKAWVWLAQQEKVAGRYSVDQMATYQQILMGDVDPNEGDVTNV